MRRTLNLSFAFLVGYEIQSSFGQTTQPNCAGCGEFATCGHTFVEDAVYGCDGIWTDEGVSNGEYLCGDGYSICLDYEYTENTLGLTLSSCTDSSIPTNAFYVTLASSDGNLDCSQPGSNDLFGCASGTDAGWLYFDSSTINCGPFGAQLSTTGYGNAWEFGWELHDAWTNGTNELDEATHYYTQVNNAYTTEAVGGVLCCFNEMDMFLTTNIDTEGGEGDKGSEEDEEGSEEDDEGSEDDDEGSEEDEGESNAYSIKIQFCSIWIIFMMYYFC